MAFKMKGFSAFTKRSPMTMVSPEEKKEKWKGESMNWGQVMIDNKPLTREEYIIYKVTNKLPSGFRSRNDQTDLSNINIPVDDSIMEEYNKMMEIPPTA